MREMAMATTKRRNTGVVYVEDKHQRFVTFSKRRSGLFKKAADASVLTGASLAILLFSPSGRPFSFFSSSSSSSMSLDPLLDAFLSGAGAGSDVVSADHSQQKPSPEVQRLTHEISQLERRIAIERAAKKIKKQEQKDAGWSRWSDASGIASLTTRGSSAAELRAVERQLEETQLKVLTQLDEIAAKEKTQDPKNYYETEEAENGVASAVTDQSPPSQDPPSSSSSNWTNNVNGNECWAELQFSDHDLGWGFNPTELPSFSSAVDDDEIAAYLFYHQDSTPPDIASIFA